MAKRFVRFCWHCRKDTIFNFIEKEDKGFERVIFGIMTLGFSECLNKDIGQCSKCGYIDKSY